VQQIIDRFVEEYGLIFDENELKVFFVFDE
jgi:hypothetical protein